MSLVLFFDTETTGKLDFKAPATAKHQPHLVQLAAMMVDWINGKVIGELNCIIEPDGWVVTDDVAKIHGITTTQAKRCGIPLLSALSVFSQFCKQAKKLVAYNIDFDSPVMEAAYARVEKPHRMDRLEKICAMKAATPLVKLPKPAGWKSAPGDEFKWPKLSEAYAHFFDGATFDGAHNAMNDVVAMVKCCQKMSQIGAIKL
jgi:DNA polymerase III subunit epsilon